MYGIHKPVLVKEAMEYLQVKKGGVYLDATLDGGGHARAILAHGAGRVLGIERDPEIVRMVKKEHIPHLEVEESSYVNMEALATRRHIKNIDGILFDFGLSSWHLESSRRGFSFLRDEALDMRFSNKEKVTAAEIINTRSVAELTEIFREYGEERLASRVAHAIVKARKQGRIMTTSHLYKIISGVLPRYSAKNPAAKIFQALRIAVNRELENIEMGIKAALRLVRPGGRVAAISFHSLEDRIVKNAFRNDTGGFAVTKKPVTPSQRELRENPRARSARLRAWEKKV
ncbi:MAG: 16S rRNA (cytosine(1402)-N(4))-methyltransferase RsmH [Candidatus Ryanbacteria bacterium]|nr:16S rRNA (cytosine(1402)-N(4))-methyltransferase RsmH [Candidatus Ryanbacteria bacterium]